MKRVRPARIVPIELWDVVVGAGILSDQLDDGAAVAAALRALHHGTAVTRCGTSVVACAGYQALYVAGGRRFAAEAAAYMSAAGRFAGEAGGLELGGADALVVDVGQTGVKLSFRGQRRVVERGGFVGERRDALREFVASGMRGVPASMVVLALPAAVDDDGVPGPCSYPALDGDADFAAAVMAAAGLAGAQCLVLNDAELAAVSARLDPRLRPDETTLVLTLGFGAGGALLLRHPRARTACDYPADVDDDSAR